MGCCGNKDERERLVPENKTNTTTARALNTASPKPAVSPYSPASSTTNVPPTVPSSSSTDAPAGTETLSEQDDFRTKCRALWDWNGDPTDPVQIAFKAGDVIALIDKEEDGGWWYGECIRTKAVGFFPGNYVEVLQRNWKVDSAKINPKIAAIQQGLALGETKN